MAYDPVRQVHQSRSSYDAYYTMSPEKQRERCPAEAARYANLGRLSCRYLVGYSLPLPGVFRQYTLLTKAWRTRRTLQVQLKVMAMGVRSGYSCYGWLWRTNRKRQTQSTQAWQETPPLEVAIGQ